MKKDNFNNTSNSTNSGSGDISSLLNIFKMLSSNGRSAASNENTASTPKEDNMPMPVDATDERFSETPQQTIPPISRTTERILSLMDEHDRAMKRIDERHNK